jgi:hypothetical protein
MVCSLMIVVVCRYSNTPRQSDGRFTFTRGRPPGRARKAYYENLLGNAGALLANQAGSYSEPRGIGITSSRIPAK